MIYRTCQQYNDTDRIQDNQYSPLVPACSLPSVAVVCSFQHHSDPMNSKESYQFMFHVVLLPYSHYLYMSTKERNRKGERPNASQGEE